MGDRGNIKIEYQEQGEIYFYTHWGGSELEETLKAALKRGKGRWNDESYLARIIFSEMIRDNVGDVTGYGIAPYLVDNENPVLIVNMKNYTVRVDGEDKITTFEEFVESGF